MRSPVLLAVLMMAGLAVGAADAPPPSSDVVARRGDLVVTAPDVSAALRQLDPALRAKVTADPQALTAFVKERVVRRIVLGEARNAKWDQNPDVIARVNEARDTVVVQTWLASRAEIDPGYPNEAELEAAYAANTAKFAVPAQYHVEQIAILVPANASKDVEEAARRKAREVRAQVTKPKADFAGIAKTASQDPGSAAKGGDLGWVREDQIVQPVRAVVRGMAENAVSEPIRGPDAWHVVKLLGTRPASTLPLDQVKPALIAALRQARSQQEANAYIEGLLKAQPVVLDDRDLASRVGR